MPVTISKLDVRLPELQETHTSAPGVNPTGLYEFRDSTGIYQGVALRRNGSIVHFYENGDKMSVTVLPVSTSAYVYRPLPEGTTVALELKFAKS